MTELVRKSIRYATYGVVVAIGFVIAAIPFLKKDDADHTSEYHPGVRYVGADNTHGDDGDDDDDGT